MSSTFPPFEKEIFALLSTAPTLSVIPFCPVNLPNCM